MANQLTSEQEQAATKAEIAGFIHQDIVGRSVDEKQAASLYKRAVNMYKTRAKFVKMAKDEILKNLPAAA